MKMPVHYTKCNRNARWGESAEKLRARARARVCVWKGEYHAYTSKGMERHAPQESGDRACAATYLGKRPCLTGVFPGARRGRGSGEGVGEGRGSTVPREFPGWCRGGKGVEWNGMELSVVPVGRGGTEGPRGRGDRRLIMQFQDCHYPRPPNSLRRFYLFCFCVSLARFFSFSFFFFFFFFFFVFSALPPHRRGRGPASFRNVNSINVTLFPFSLKTGDGR